jgi:hypothetical protein
MKHVHRACLQKWINMTYHSMSPKCDICKTPFPIIKQTPHWYIYPFRIRLISFLRSWLRDLNHLWENRCTHDVCEIIRYSVFVFLCLLAMIQGRLMYWLIFAPEGIPFVVHGVDDFVLMLFAIGLNMWLFRLISRLFEKEIRLFFETLGWGVLVFCCAILSGIFVRLELLLLFRISWKTFEPQLAVGSSIGWHFVLGFLGIVPHHFIIVSLVWWIRDFIEWRTRNSYFIVVNGN